MLLLRDFSLGIQGFRFPIWGFDLIFIFLVCLMKIDEVCDEDQEQEREEYEEQKKYLHDNGS